MHKATGVVIVLLIIAAGGIGYTKYGQKPKASLEATPSPITQSNPSPNEPVKVDVSSGLTLTIVSPADGQTVNTATVTVKGKTIPLAEISINDQDLKADKNGQFSATVNLDQGENSIIITANDDSGNYAEKEITVSFEPQSQE